MGTVILCDIKDHRVVKGESIYSIIKDECKTKDPDTLRLALDWADKYGREVFDHDEWNRMVSGNNIRAEENITGTDKDKKFVLVKEGDVINAAVVRTLHSGVIIDPEDLGSIRARDRDETRALLGLGCFSGAMYLKLADGSAISFEEYAGRFAGSEEKPEVASYDTSAGRVVYQRPVEVLVHPNNPEQMVMLQARDTGSDLPLNLPLEVTDDHLLLTNAGDWVAAGELSNGTALVTDGGEYVFDETATTSFDASLTVYNLSFGSSESGLFPTYLVSPDGLHWFVAHNIKESI